MTKPRRIQSEEGFAVATAMVLLMVILMLGLVVLQQADFQTRSSAHERAGEAAFNLAESAMEAEAFQIQQAWPGTLAQAYPTCTSGSAATAGCPGATVTNSFNTQYAGSGFTNATWKVQVVDDTGTGGASYYSDGLANVGWDSNADNRLWVRAEATIYGQRRIVVTQMVRQLHTIVLPANVITAGATTTENNGNKVIIETKDNNGLTGEVKVRCADIAIPTSGDPCLGWVNAKGQVDPLGSYQASYVDPNGGYSTLSPLALAQLRNTAIAAGAGHYFNGTCPTSFTGLVFVENVTGTCTANTGTWNSDSAPGALIFASGSLEFNGSLTYTGVIYMANAQGTVPLTGPCTTLQANTVLTVHGGASVYGGVFVDKCGIVDAGEAKNDINYDQKAFGGIQAFATPEAAKNTFKIVPNP
jgi:Tfp pilus assembly protein PilX